MRSPVDGAGGVHSGPAIYPPGSREGPRVVIGIPSYNGATHLRLALDSLLRQRFEPYAVVLLDDCSSDETWPIAREYAASDPRLRCEQNGRRIGLVRNWRAVFEWATLAYPSASYFAWGSDHDLWDPDWLRVLVDALDANPEAVLAYPRTGRCDELGNPLGLDPRSFDSTAIAHRRERLRRTSVHMVAGNMIYGLFRVPALRRCGPLPLVLLPDRLLLAELSLHGTFVEIDLPLWQRRYATGTKASLARQRASLYSATPPLTSRVPWFATHTSVLGWRLVVEGRGAPEVGRLAGLSLTADYGRAAWRKYLKEAGETPRGREIRARRKRARSFRRRQRHRIVHHSRRLARFAGLSSGWKE